MPPYTLQDEREIERRLALLGQPHVIPLEELRAELRSERGPDYDTPHFDPLDGGVAAEALFLLEAPGGRAVGSGFVSRDNPDPTARNVFTLLEEAGIPRGKSLLWNVVPWYVGTGRKIRPVHAADLRAAAPWLQRLIGLLSSLRVVVLMGRKAQRVEPQVQALSRAAVLKSYHPSNLSLNRRPERRDEILEVLQRADQILRAGQVGA